MKKFIKKILLSIYSKILYTMIIFFSFLKKGFSYDMSLNNTSMIDGKMVSPPSDFEIIYNILNWILLFILFFTGIYFIIGLFLFFKKDKKLDIQDGKDLEKGGKKILTNREKGKKYIIRSLIIVIILFLLHSLIEWFYQTYIINNNF